MSFHHIFKDVPYNRLLTIDNLLGGLDGLDNAALYEFADDEGLVQLGCHVFGKTAFVHLQLGADHDDRTSGVVDTLAEEVLTETTLLAFEGIAERLQRAVGIGLDGRGTTRVVKQRVNSFLKHTFLVAQDYVGSLDFDESFQSIVADDYTTIEVVKITGGKTTSVQRYQRTQFGWNYGHCL